MGMFNTILEKLPMMCCGAWEDNWQSKWLKTAEGLQPKCLEEYPMHQITEGEFHSYCGRCKKMTYYYIVGGRIKNWSHVNGEW